MADHAGTAKRRRERWLRQWPSSVCKGTEDGQNQGGVELEQHEAPRRQEPPLPGVRPGIFAELGPQRSDCTVQRSAGAACPYWRGRRERQWTPRLFASSRLQR